MLALRYAGLLALVVWIGGLVALGWVAAPAVFDAVAARSVVDGRVLSGAIFGEILRRFHLVAYGCSALYLLSLLARAVLGPRPRRAAVRGGIAVAMLATTVVSGMVISPRIERLRQEIGGAPSALPDGDARRLAFGRLHGWSTTLQLVPLAGGLALLLWELRD